MSRPVHPLIITLKGVVRTLYVEELKATMRGRFAWLGAAAVLLAIGGLERRHWLMAKMLVLVTLAVCYYVALLPMMLVYAAHVDVPPLLQKFLLWTPGLLMVSIAIGSLIGVLFIGRSVAAPIGTSMGVLLAYAGLIPLQELMVAQGNGATRTGHITLASPAVLLKNGLRFALVAPNIPSTTIWTWISLLVVLTGAFALAVWVFLRAQGVETWETTRRQGWTIAAAIVTLSVIPSIVAETNYETPAPRQNSAPPIRGLFSRAGSSLALVIPGRPAPLQCCSTILNRGELMAMATDEETRRDLLLLLPVSTSDQITDLRIQITGENGLQATADAAALEQRVPHLETRSYPYDSGPPDAGGGHIASGWVARVPVTLNPSNPWDIGGDRYPLTVNARYRVAGDGQTHAFSARGAIDAQVASGIYEMGAASLMLPLMCVGAAVRRWRRTR